MYSFLPDGKKWRTIIPSLSPIRQLPLFTLLSAQFFAVQLFSSRQKTVKKTCGSQHEISSTSKKLEVKGDSHVKSLLIVFAWLNPLCYNWIMLLFVLLLLLKMLLLFVVVVTVVVLNFIKIYVSLSASTSPAWSLCRIYRCVSVCACVSMQLVSRVHGIVPRVIVPRVIVPRKLIVL